MGVHAQRGARIAYIDMNVILSKNKEFITANRILDEKIAQWKKEIELKKIQLKRIEDQFAVEKILLTPELIADRELEIKDFATDVVSLQEKRFGPNGDWVAQEKILIQPIQDEVLAAVQLIAERNKFDYVYDKSSAIVTLYSEKKYDISELVLKSILRQEKLENLEIDFTDDLIQKRRDSLRKVNELRKESLQRKRDSILKARKNKIK